MIDTAPKAAQAYQLLPNLDDDQRSALKESIRENGILQPIEVDEAGRILDGHHRAAIAAELGIACPSRTINGLDEAGKRRYAITVNLMRRQLDKTMRGALVAQLRSEGMSVRAIAAETGLPKTTVARDVAQVSHMGHLPETVTGADGKTYRASQPERPAPAAFREPEPEPADVDEPLTDDERDMLALAEATIAANLPNVDRSALDDRPEPTEPTGDMPAFPWPTTIDKPAQPEDETAHAARVSSDIRRLITLAQTFGTAELRAQAVRLYADNLGNAPMPPSGVVSAQELRTAAEAISALAKDWKKRK
jgi:hypothetical protein